jgi:polysaccharide biosynthesis protein PslG
MRGIVAMVAGAAALSIATSALAQPDPRAGWPGPMTIGEGFGVQVKEWETSEAELDAIKAAGFGLLRFGIGWPYVENAQGEYDWERYDRFIASVRMRSFRSIVILWGSHSSYVGTSRAKGSEAYTRDLPAPVSEQAVRGFARFASAAAKRYAGEDIIWELWNEPDLDRFWPPKADGDAYARLALATCQSVRQVAPSARIIGPASATMPGWKGMRDAGFSRTVLQSPLASCIDALSFHSYRIERGAAPKSPESVMADNARAAEFVADNTPKDRSRLRLICSEWGFNSVDLTEQQQAAYVVRTHLSNLLSGVPVTVWYEWRDSLGSPDDPEAHFGLVDFRRNGKPALTAVRSLLPLIGDHTVVRRLQTPDPRDFVVLLRGPNHSRKLLFWTSRRSHGGDLSLDLGTREQRFPINALPRTINLGPEDADPSIVIGGAQ